MINQFARYIRKHTPQVQYLDDMGLPGLRESYHPDRMIEQ